jgi:hypothetical protein
MTSLVAFNTCLGPVGALNPITGFEQKGKYLLEADWANSTPRKIGLPD